MAATVEAVTTAVVPVCNCPGKNKRIALNVKRPRRQRRGLFYLSARCRRADYLVTAVPAAFWFS
jgi:hypothetical protein